MFNRVLAAAAAFLTTMASAGPVSVTTWRYDTGRTSQYLTETNLTPSNVNQLSFGKLYSYAVDGFVFAEPLYLTGINVGGKVRNVVFIATQHDSVYAFDADSNTALWKASLIDALHGAAAGATTVPNSDVDTGDIVPEVGITGTPVIDATNGVLYVVGKSLESGNYVQRLHALNIYTGNENPNSPAVIQASVPGNGAGSSSGTLAFLPQWELQRTGLLLIDGTVYVGFGAHGDNGNYHGWLLPTMRPRCNRQVCSIRAPTAEAMVSGSPARESPRTSSMELLVYSSSPAIFSTPVRALPRLFFRTRKDKTSATRSCGSTARAAVFPSAMIGRRSTPTI